MGGAAIRHRPRDPMDMLPATLPLAIHSGLIDTYAANSYIDDMAKTFSNVEKKDRNKQLVAFIKKGHSYREAAKEFGLKSVGTVHRIYKRHRAAKGVQSKRSSVRPRRP